MRILFGLVSVALLANFCGAQVKLSIIHFNDFHARFEPISGGGGSCKPGENEQGLCYGGIARLYKAVNEKRNSLPNPIVLNAGDNYQGTLMYSLFKWNITLDFMKQFNFDASAFGNHEFDDKVAGIVPYAEGLGSPLLAANMDASEEPTLQGKFSPSIVIEKGGTKIGIIGCISSKTPAMSSPEKIKFSEEIPSVIAEVDKLKKQDVKIIILVSHSGYDVDLEMADEIPDLDIIVGSHTHTFLYTGTPPSTDVAQGEYPTVVKTGSRRTLVVQAMAFSKYLGVLEVNFDADGEVETWSGNPILMDKSIVEDPEMLAALKPWTDEANIIGQESIGNTAVHLDSTKCYNQECNIGNLFTDAMVHEHTELENDDGWTNAAIAIMNPGGLRAPIGETSTDITFSDLITSQPFQNTIDTIELQGKDIVELMELAASKPSYTRRSTRFGDGNGCFQVSGIRAAYNLKRPEGKRLVEIFLRCARCKIPEFLPVEPEAWYTVAMPSFLSSGSSFPLISERGRNLTVGRIDSEIYAEYITKESPIVNAIEGRILLTSAGSSVVPSKMGQTEQAGLST